MLKELKYLLFLIVIVLFFFLSFKYYFSNENKKNSYRSLKNIEDKSGRDRNAPKFSSRTLDIDIVLQISDDEEILFESDEIAKYRFVSEPLEELL